MRRGGSSSSGPSTTALDKRLKKVEEAIKPFAIKELNELSLFLKALKKHNTLNQLLEFKD